MPNLLEYFNNDFNREMSMDMPLTFTVQSMDNTIPIQQSTLEVLQKIRINIQTSVRVFTFYIPFTDDALLVIKTLIENIEEQKKQADGISAIGGYLDDVVLGAHQNTYSTRIYFYSERLLTEGERAWLNGFCKDRHVYVTLRSSDYVSSRMKAETPEAFISHDSRDKQEIARPLANGLGSRLCFVWYDEYSLKIGDSLRESIEKGIREAKKCIIILTPNYLSNPGWGKKEFNSIFTREIVMDEKVVLPIWYGVTRKQVYEYSPSIVDTFALIWPSPIGVSKDKYEESVQRTISQVHSALTITVPPT